MLPASDNDYAVVRDRLTVLFPGEDEREFDYATELEAEIAEACGGTEKEVKSTPAQKAIEDFLLLSTDDKKNVKSFVYPYGSSPDEVINWRILE